MDSETTAYPLDKLRNLADSFSQNERPTFTPPSSADAIQAFESVLGFRLPSQLLQFLSTYDAIIAMNVHNGYWIGGLFELTRSVGRDDFPRSIMVGREPHTIIPVATDGGGNAFLLSVDDGRIWRWDHETGNTTNVANSFVAFLRQVAEDWDHAIFNDEDWEYLV